MPVIDVPVGALTLTGRVPNNTTFEQLVEDLGIPEIWYDFEQLDADGDLRNTRGRATGWDLFSRNSPTHGVAGGDIEGSTAMGFLASSSQYFSKVIDPADIAGSEGLVILGIKLNSAATYGFWSFSPDTDGVDAFNLGYVINSGGRAIHVWRQTGTSITDGFVFQGDHLHPAYVDIFDGQFHLIVYRQKSNSTSPEVWVDGQRQADINDPVSGNNLNRWIGHETIDVGVVGAFYATTSPEPEPPTGAANFVDGAIDHLIVLNTPTPVTDAQIIQLSYAYIGARIHVPVASLTLAGLAPTVSTGNEIDVPTGSLTLTGQVPTALVGNNVTVEVPVGSLVLAGVAPTVINPQGVTVPVGVLTLSGLAPTVTAGGGMVVEVPVGSLVLAGVAPTILNPQAVTVPVGALILTGLMPVIGGQLLDIDSLSPSSFADGELVSVNGQGFGLESGLVLVGGRAQIINSWADTQVQFVGVRAQDNLGAVGVNLYKALSKEPYNLYGSDQQNRPAIPFRVNWPRKPNITQTIQVPSQMSLAAAAAIAGARIEVAAGSYGAFALSVNDQHWVLNNGATFTDFTTTNHPTRQIVEGGVVVKTGVDSAITIICDDLLLKNIRIESQGGLNFGLGAFGQTPAQYFRRVALVHVTSIQERTGFFCQGPNGDTDKHNDLIIAACYVQGGMRVGSSGIESAIRVMGVNRCIIVDTRARCGFDGQGIKHTFRSHYGNEFFWMRRNLTEYGDGIYFDATAGSPLLPGDEMGRHWVYDYDIHTTNLSAYAFRDMSPGLQWYPYPLVVDGCNGYTDMTANDNWIWSPVTKDTIGSTSTSAWQAAPSLATWLAADGLPAGADH